MSPYGYGDSTVDFPASTNTKFKVRTCLCKDAGTAPLILMSEHPLRALSIEHEHDRPPVALDFSSDCCAVLQFWEVGTRQICGPGTGGKGHTIYVGYIMSTAAGSCRYETEGNFGQ